MSIKRINTGGKAPLDAADCLKKVGEGETQGTRVADYVYHVCGKDFCKKLSQMSDYECGNELNSIGYKAVPALLFKAKLGIESIPLGEKFADFYEQVKGSTGGNGKDQVVARGWKLLNGKKHPEIWDEKLMYVVDGRAMHKNVYDNHGSWEALIKAGGAI